MLSGFVKLFSPDCRRYSARGRVVRIGPVKRDALGRPAIIACGGSLVVRPWRVAGMIRPLDCGWLCGLCGVCVCV